ncbi:MAG: hypothetical protein WDN00_17665 [Limisphaerales bacterium]
MPAARIGAGQCQETNCFGLPRSKPAEHDRPEIAKLFTELVQDKALDILAGPFRTLKNRQVLNALLDEGRRVLE